MAAANTSNEKPWAIWLRNQLREHGLRAKDITERSGGEVGSYALSRWLDSKRDPDVESIRKVCAALGVPIADGLLGAQLLAPDEIGATVVQRPDPGALTKRELLAYRRELDDVLDARIPDDQPDADMSGDHPTVTPIRPVPVVRPEGRRGADWAARPKPE